MDEEAGEGRGVNFDPLEQTQDFKNPLGHGVWRRSTDPDTIVLDYEDGMRSYHEAPELSEKLERA
jgi:hypothetical protein